MVVFVVFLVIVAVVGARLVFHRPATHSRHRNLRIRARPHGAGQRLGHGRQRVLALRRRQSPVLAQRPCAVSGTVCRSPTATTVRRLRRQEPEHGLVLQRHRQPRRAVDAAGDRARRAACIGALAEKSVGAPGISSSPSTSTTGSTCSAATVAFAVELIDAQMIETLLGPRPLVPRGVRPACTSWSTRTASRSRRLVRCSTRPRSSPSAFRLSRGSSAASAVLDLSTPGFDRLFVAVP